MRPASPAVDKSPTFYFTAALWSSAHGCQVRDAHLPHFQTAIATLAFLFDLTPAPSASPHPLLFLFWRSGVLASYLPGHFFDRSSLFCGLASCCIE